MEITKFIKENNVYDFANLKAILESQQFGLKIKEDEDMPNLFLIHTTELTNLSLPFINECNGIIMDKNTFNIICYTFNKCLKSISNDIDIDNIFYEPLYEGTLIRLYFNENRWILSTKKCLDASKSKWISTKNFSELFNECVGNIKLDSLNTSYCYSFVISHPENNIISNCLVPTVYHISTRDMITFNEIEVNIGIPNSKKNPVTKGDFDTLLNYFTNNHELSNEGCIFIDTKYNRYKIKNVFFQYIRTIWGNTNNRYFRYLELRKDINLLQEYIKYFPNDKTLFLDYERKISNLAHSILKTYIDRHIIKGTVKVPFFYTKVIYKLHGDYFKSKVKTNFDKVMLTLLELDAKQVCFMSNHLDKQNETVLMET